MYLLELQSPNLCLLRHVLSATWNIYFTVQSQVLKCVITKASTVPEALSSI